jgi:hypothetical protein
MTWFDLRGRLVLQEQFSGPYEIGTHTLSFAVRSTAGTIGFGCIYPADRNRLKSL